MDGVRAPVSLRGAMVALAVPVAVAVVQSLASCGARTELFVGAADAGSKLDAARDAAPPNVPCGLASGQTRTLASQQDPTALAIDDAYVYWYDHATQTVLRISKKGGEIEHLATDPRDVRFMAVDDADVYWTNDIQLSRTSKTGARPVQFLAATTYSGGVALDGTNVYFAGAGAVVQQMAKTNGTVVTLADNQSQPEGVAVDSSYVYWVNGLVSAQRGFMRVPIGGTGVQAVGVVENGSHIVLDDAFAYWTDQAGAAPSVVRAAKDGSGQTLRVIGGMAPSKPSGIGVDDTSIWWTDFVADTVSQTPKAQGPTRVIATGQTLTRELAVDAACVYWTTETEDATGGTVVAYGK
jgi:hypothetical protein